MKKQYELEEPIAQLLRQYRYSLFPRTGPVTEPQLVAAIVSSFLLEHRAEIQENYEKVLLGEVLPLTYLPKDPHAPPAASGSTPAPYRRAGGAAARAAALSFVQRASGRRPSKNRRAA